MLAVSLSSGGDDGPGGNPLEAADREMGGKGSDPDAGERLTLSAEGGRTGQTPPDDGGNPRPGTPKAKPEEGVQRPPAVDKQGRPRVLRSPRGLTASQLEDYMLYTAEEGDTWNSLADRFYRSGTYVALLQAANEDLAKPSEGATLLVPVYDFRAARAAPERKPHEPAPKRPVGPDVTPKETSKVPSTYVIADGDTLSEISQKLYGTSRRWNDLYQANKDVLPDPDTLTVGVTLRVPQN